MLGAVRQKLPVAEQMGAGESRAEQLEEILNKGMDFLAVLFRMSAGIDLAFENQQIGVDKITGEVSLQFKMMGGKK